MELLELQREWNELSSLCEETGEMLERGIKESVELLQQTIEKIQKVLPVWIEFIEKTEIGTTEELLENLQIILNAMENQDEVLLQDAILFGMKRRAEVYRQIVEEALA